MHISLSSKNTYSLLCGRLDSVLSEQSNDRCLSTPEPNDENICITPSSPYSDVYECMYNPLELCPSPAASSPQTGNKICTCTLCTAR